jgi:hypothetical protein
VDLHDDLRELDEAIEDLQEETRMWREACETRVGAVLVGDECVVRVGTLEVRTSLAGRKDDDVAEEVAERVEQLTSNVRLRFESFAAVMTAIEDQAFEEAESSGKESTETDEDRAFRTSGGLRIFNED